MHTTAGLKSDKPPSLPHGVHKTTAAVILPLASHLKVPTKPQIKTEIAIQEQGGTHSLAEIYIYNICTLYNISKLQLRVSIGIKEATATERDCNEEVAMKR